MSEEGAEPEYQEGAEPEYQIDDGMLSSAFDVEPETVEDPGVYDTLQPVTVTPTAAPITLKPVAEEAKSFFRSLGTLELAILVTAGVVGLLFMVLILSYVYSSPGEGLQTAPPAITGV